MAMVEKSAGYTMSLSRSVTDPRWVGIRLRKAYWSVDTGSRSRLIAETGFYAEGMGERDIVESALRELLRALVDELA